MAIAMDMLVELWAHGERGRLEPRAVPLAEIVGPNAGLLEALFCADRQVVTPRALEVGDVIRVPGVGRYLICALGFGLLPSRDWTPPLDGAGHLLPEAAWQVPAGTRYLNAADQVHPHLARPALSRTPPRPPARGPRRRRLL